VPSRRRYAGDTYAGGNRWVLAALWLAQTSLGLLPEQVTDDGEPAWVVPLAWSHAMLLLAARPESSLARG
jgi:GH15 family glucan-1,4-alpha-glucosidase